MLGRSRLSVQREEVSRDNIRLGLSQHGALQLAKKVSSLVHLVLGELQRGSDYTELIMMC